MRLLKLRVRLLFQSASYSPPLGKLWQFRRQRETVDWRYDCIAYISAYPKRCPLTPRWPLDAFFEPRSVAETPGSIGLTLLTNLAATPFGGTVYPVNPKRIPAS